MTGGRRGRLCAGIVVRLGSSVLIVALAIVGLQLRVLAAPSIRVEPASGPPGSNIQITGSGFQRGEPVQVGWDPGQPDQTFFGNMQADQTGSFSLPGTVPAAAQPGQHQVFAQGAASGPASVPFSVTSQAQPTATPATTPAQTPSPSTPAVSTTPTQSTTPTPSSPPWLLFGLLGAAAVAIAAAVWFFLLRRGDDGTAALVDPCAQLIDDCDKARSEARAAAEAAAAAAAAAAEAQAACDQARAATAAAAAAAGAAEAGGDSSAWAEGGEGSAHPGARETRYDLQVMREAEQAGEKIDRTDPATWARLREQARQKAQQKLKDAQAAEAAACAAAQTAADAAAAASAAAAAAQAKADELCARAEECRKQQQASTPPPPPTTGGTTDGGGTGGTTSGASSGGGGGGKPGTGGGGGGQKVSTGGGCQEGATKKEKKCEVEVDMYLLAGAQLQIGSNYPFGGEGQQAAEELEFAKTKIDIIVSLLGAVRDPVGSILGQLGIPSFSTTYNAPAKEAIKALQRLAKIMQEKAQSGDWLLICPKQRYRFYCEITYQCRGGAWVVIARDFGCQKVGEQTMVPYPFGPIQVDVPAAEGQAALDRMSNYFLNLDKQAEAQVEACARMCAG